MREGGKPADQGSNVEYLSMANGATVYEIGSGQYHFESLMPR